MAKESGSEQPPKPVRLEIERSRERVARDVRGLRYELDFPAKIRRSFQRQTAVWVVAAIAVGVVVVTLPGMRKKVSVDVSRDAKAKKKLAASGLLLGLVRIAVPLLKPVVINFVRNRMAGGGGSSAYRSTSKARF
jgi:hypothetical protein